MPTCITKFTFPSDLKADAKMARLVLKYTSDYVMDELLEAYESESVDADFINKVIAGLMKEEIGMDAGERGSALYGFVDEVLSNQLSDTFGLIKIEERWDDEGHDDHYYYDYLDTKDAVNKALKEIRAQVALLAKYGKLVTVEIEN